MALSRIGSEGTTGFGRRNIIINGGMSVFQRSTSETGLGASSGYFTADRWKIDSNTAGRVTMAQDTSDTPAGFGSALKITTTTADTSVAAGEYFVLQQGIEGQNLQQLQSGTSGARKFTVSFYVKGNAAATYMLEMQDLDNAEVNGQQFSVTTSWTRVELTFDSDTSNAFGNDNGNSLELKIWLHAGSNFTSGTYSPNSWYSNGTSANRAVGIDSIMDSTSRTLSIAGIQLEVGSTATEFEHRSYGEELALCERYYQLSGGVGRTSSTTGADIYSVFKTPMRATPSATINYTISSFAQLGRPQANINSISSIFMQTRYSVGCVIVTSDTGLTAGLVAVTYGLAFAFNAEL